MSNALNFLMICSRLPAPPNDGGAIYMYQSAKTLANLGHTVSIACFESEMHQQDETMLSEFAKVYSAPGHFKPYGFRSLVHSLKEQLPIPISDRMNIPIMEEILNTIPDQSFDAILIEGLQCFHFEELLRSKFKNTPLILRQVNVEHLLLERNAKLISNPLKKAIYTWQASLMKNFERSALTKADAVSVISAKDGEHFRQLHPDITYTVVEAGASLPPLFHNSEKQFNILLSGTWSWAPNQDGLKWFFDQVYPLIHQQFPDLKLDIVGGELDTSILDNMSTEQVRYHGFVEDIVQFRQQSLLTVIPLISGSGMKIKVLECLASGLPVITTKYGAEGISITDGKEYVLANTPEEILEAISKIVNDEHTRDQLATNGRAFIEQHHRWEHQMEKLVELTKSLKTN
jgi:glycosyltransferase involved in cell wall biosynthesis